MVFIAVAVAAIASCTGLFGFDGLRLAPMHPSKPGLDLTGGGNVSSTARYKLVGVVGESPGESVVSKSPSYTLYGGVVGTWR